MLTDRRKSRSPKRAYSGSRKGPSPISQSRDPGHFRESGCQASIKRSRPRPLVSRPTDTTTRASAVTVSIGLMSASDARASARWLAWSSMDSGTPSTIVWIACGGKPGVSQGSRRSQVADDRGIGNMTAAAETPTRWRLSVAILGHIGPHNDRDAATAQHAVCDGRFMPQADEVDQVHLAAMTAQPAGQRNQIAERSPTPSARVGQPNHGNRAVDQLRGPVRVPAGRDHGWLNATAFQSQRQFSHDIFRTAKQRPEARRHQDYTETVHVRLS